MDPWELFESKSVGGRIRPKREDIIKLKKVLREKYKNEDQESLFGDNDSIFTQSSVYTTGSSH